MNPYVLPGCNLTPEQIIKEWEKHFKMNASDLIPYDKSEDVSMPRNIFCYALFTYGSASKEWIAGYIHRNRITVHNSIKVCKNVIDTHFPEGKMVMDFVEKLSDLSNESKENYTINVDLNREDIKILMPDLDPWVLVHWNLQRLWALYEERRYSGKQIKKVKSRQEISGKSTLTH